MNIALKIAFRYLFAKKSHNVINVISAVSAAGLAVGTAALILILSVYNGFNRIVDENLSDMDADISVRRLDAAPFDVAELESVFSGMQKDQRIGSISSELSFQIFLKYGESQCVAFLRGVDSVFPEQTKVRSHVISGEFGFWNGEIPLSCLGAGLAHSLGVSPYFVQPIELYYPEREKAISVLSPSSSLRKEVVYPGSVLSVSEEMDRDLVVVDISLAQRLYAAELVSSVNVALKDRAQLKEVTKDYSILPEGFELADRYRQHADIFRMMRVEKFAVFLILVFVVLIVSLNISGSLAMLKVEKAADMETLRALGASDSMRKSIFRFEGWLVSLTGIAVGLVAGLAAALVQQRFGIVKIPGNFLVEAYPVCVKATDVVLSVAALCLVGLLAALIPDKNS